MFAFAPAKALTAVPVLPPVERPALTFASAFKALSSVVECEPSLMVADAVATLTLADALVFLPYEAEADACAVPTLAVTDNGPLLSVLEDAARLAVH